MLHAHDIIMMMMMTIIIITCGQSNLSKGRITAAHGRFNRIHQVASICTPIGIRTILVLYTAASLRVYRPQTWASILFHNFLSVTIISNNSNHATPTVATTRCASMDIGMVSEPPLLQSTCLCGNPHTKKQLYPFNYSATIHKDTCTDSDTQPVA